MQRGVEDLSDLSIVTQRLADGFDEAVRTNSLHNDLDWETQTLRKAGRGHGKAYARQAWNVLMVEFNEDYYALAEELDIDRSSANRNVLHDLPNPDWIVGFVRQQYPGKFIPPTEEQFTELFMMEAVASIGTEQLNDSWFGGYWITVEQWRCGLRCLADKCWMEAFDRNNEDTMKSLHRDLIRSATEGLPRWHNRKKVKSVPHLKTLTQQLRLPVTLASGLLQKHWEFK